MATGNEILQYQGNPLAGSGANVGIPVSSPDQLTAVQTAGRDATLFNIDQQNRLFQQKIKDHAQLLNLINSGDIKVGNTLDSDRPIVKQALDELDTAFYNRSKKGFNDIDATVAYNKALRKAQDVATQAQTRFVVDKQDQTAAASALPEEKQSILDNLNKYKSGFWNDYVPPVKAITIDHPGMTSSITRDTLVPNAGISSQPGLTHRFTTRTNKDGTTTTWDTVSNKPVSVAQQKIIAAQNNQPGNTAQGGLSLFTTIPGKFYDYNKMLANASDDFHDEKQRLNQVKYMDFILNQSPPAQQKAILDQANLRFDTYNKQRGLNPGDPGYVEPIGIVVDPNGQRHAADQNGRTLSIPEFNAKMALASISGDYVEKDKLSVDKDAATYLLGKQKADTDEFYKKAMAANGAIRANAYAANLRQQMKLRGTDASKDQYLDDLYRRNIIQQESLIEGMGGNKFRLAPIKQEKSLPVFTIEGTSVKQLIPIDGKPVYGNGTDKPSSKTDKPLYYKGGHYDPYYQIEGNNVTAQELTDFYNRFKKVQGSTWKGSIDDFIKQAVDNGKINVRIQGANGSTDEQLSRAAQRIISNKDTKKFQEGVFSTEYNDEQIPDNEPQER